MIIILNTIIQYKIYTYLQSPIAKRARALPRRFALTQSSRTYIHTQSVERSYLLPCALFPSFHVPCLLHIHVPCFLRWSSQELHSSDIKFSSQRLIWASIPQYTISYVLHFISAGLVYQLGIMSPIFVANTFVARCYTPIIYVLRTSLFKVRRTCILHFRMETDSLSPPVEFGSRVSIPSKTPTDILSPVVNCH